MAYNLPLFVTSKIEVCSYLLCSLSMLTTPTSQSQSMMGDLQSSPSVLNQPILIISRIGLYTKVVTRNCLKVQSSL